MADRYIAPSTIGPATDSRKPNAFEKVQMWWAEDSTSRENWGFSPNKKGTKWGTIVGSSYSDEDYLSDAKRDAQRTIDKVNSDQVKKDKEIQRKAELIFIQDKKEIVQQLSELQKDPIANSGSIQSMIDLLDKNSISELDQGKRDVILERAKTETVSPTIAQQPGVPAPVRGTEQPGATPVAGQQGNGGGAYVPPVKNAVNQYTFQDGHKEFDSTAIPEVLNGGKITPVQYFRTNGMTNWVKDSKRIATEMGMSNYRGTPEQNYAMVAYLEQKKNGNPTANGQETGTENATGGRRFDGIKYDTIPNRFTQEEREQIMAMTPDEQKQFISKKNLEDLKKMLPGNVGLINKVFGTNYTSDDLTGGINRATIMGTGMTAKGMEVQKLIDGLLPGQADKFMSKGAELDNLVKDGMRMNTGSVQSGRRKILESMVDGTTPMGEGTTIDAQDQEYMQAYKDYKRVKANADKYNQMVGAWNNIAGDNIAKNRLLKDIQNFVNNMKDTDPQSFQALQGDLDKIPEFIGKGGTGKIPTATVAHPADAKATAPSSTKKVDIVPPSNNNIPDATDGAYTKTNAESNGGLPAPVVDKGGTILKDTANPTPSTKSSGGGYVREEYDPRIGYSSNQISKG